MLTAPTSWLDHIICSFDFYSIILDIFILDKLPSSDHLPLCCSYRFDLCIESRDSSCDDVIIPSINYQWAEASDVEIEKYMYRLSSQVHLRAVNIPDTVRCYDTACVCDEHKIQLDVYFSFVIHL